MKTHRFNLVVGLLLAVALPALAADLNVTGNLTVTGTVDSDGNSTSFGAQSTSTPTAPGVIFTYTDSTTDTLKFLINRNPASWLWVHNTSINAMRLDSAHQLILYNAAGTTAGVTLTPISNQLSLGTATLTGSGANLAAGGALTVASGITNTNGALTGGASGLTLNSGTAATNITLTAAGAGDIVFNTNSLERARIKYTGYVGIGTPGPLTKLDVRGTSATADATVQIVGTGVSTLLLGQDANGGVIRGQGGSSSLRFLVGGTADQAAAGSGTEAIRIVSSGNVGIGTAAWSSYGARLAVHYNAAADQVMTLRNTNASGLSSIRLEDNNGNYEGDIGYYNLAGSTGIRIGGNASVNTYFPSGNVGIGTSVPDKPLHVSFDAVSTPAVKIGSGTDAQGWYTFLGNDTAGATTSYIGNAYNNDAAVFQIRMKGTAAAGARLTVLGNGNVGIGTTSPATTLQVVGPITAGSASSTQGTDYLYGNYSSGKLFVLGSQYSSAASFLGFGVKAKPGAVGYLSSTAISIGRSAVEADGGIIAFLTGAPQTSTDGGAVAIGERMRIDSSGNVGIGTTSPNAGLDIWKAYSAGTDSLRFSYNDGSAYWMGIQPYVVGGGNVGYKFRTNNGNITVDALAVTGDGKIGIGTLNPTHKLAVNGTIRAKEIIVDNTGWADYVFDSNYRLAPLSEVESHIKAEKHLPGIPSAAEIAEHGVSMGDMQSKLLSKIEELTLHMIQQEKLMTAQQNEIATLRQQVSELKTASAP